MILGVGRSQPFRRAARVAFALALVSAPVIAEVSVVTDSDGRYQRTIVLRDTRGPAPMYWSQVRSGVDGRAFLNLNGDRMGDSAPLVREQPGTRQPWVLWSASDGHDREIAFATWANGRWQGPQLLERADNQYADVHARLAFDALGRPVAVWQRNEPTPRIYLSVFSQGAWSTPMPVSDASTPGRLPSVAVEGGRAVVGFHTPRGRTVLFIPLPEPGVSIDGNGPLDGPNPPPPQSNPNDRSAPPDSNERPSPPAGTNDIPFTKRTDLG